MASSSPIRHWLRISPLGSGSSSSVSLAINLHNGLPFALKSLHLPSPSRLLALHHELHILQSLHSPRILRCFGAHSSPPHGFTLFLEYMPDGSISDLLQKSGGKLNESLARLYTRGILEGLHYLHQRRIVHCDIKGQNILVGSSGVKIADFGAAKTLDDQKIRGSEQESFGGTPLWMAPEVVQGIEQGLPSDVWSLGCTVVEMLQGRPPWANITDVATLLFQIGCSQEDPPLPESLSAEAQDFVCKCLQRDPGARWTTAQLLQHPFVKVQPKSDSDSPDYHDQGSPRGALEFGIESDEDDEASDSLPILSMSRKIARADSLDSLSMPRKIAKTDSTAQDKGMARRCISSVSPREATIPSTGIKWITVRSTEGWSEDRRKPFMETLLGAAYPNLVHVRKGCKVNLDSVAFLRKRKATE